MMLRTISPMRTKLALATLAAAAILGTGPAAAQANPGAANAAAGADTRPPPNPAAEQAVRAHAQRVLAALNGQGALPSAQQFTDDFNTQVQPEQLSTVFNNVRTSVGTCQITAQMRAPVSHAAGYLLACEKAYVPMELMVENNAPYRIQGLLIRPSFWKN